jgi:UDP-N-acetylglucosamine:LPS N-acetylglucosamine transferase
MSAVSEILTGNISIHGFINRMDYAFAAADIIISRAGAGTISELCLVGKPVFWFHHRMLQKIIRPKC